MVKSIYKLEALRSACESCTVTAGHTQLFRELKSAAPELEFFLAFERGGWHRAGGVVDRDGSRLSGNLREWAQQELDEVSPDMDWPDNWMDLLATRVDGRTVYFAASSGPRAWDFVQLELETLQEVVDRELFTEEFVPADIEEFLDPPHAKRLEPKPIGDLRYRFHSVYHIAQLLEELDKSIGTNRRFARFLVDWENSRAAREARFCDQWLLRIFSYVDRFGEQKMEATPFSIREAVEFEPGEELPTGLQLGQALTEYDRKAGYPMAWFFHMLTDQKDLHVVATQVCRDHDVGKFAYLAEQDLSVVRAWYREPYCF